MRTKRTGTQFISTPVCVQTQTNEQHTCDVALYFRQMSFLFEQVCCRTAFVFVLFRPAQPNKPHTHTRPHVIFALVRSICILFSSDAALVQKFFYRFTPATLLTDQFLYSFLSISSGCSHVMVVSHFGSQLPL